MSFEPTSRDPHQPEHRSPEHRSPDVSEVFSFDHPAYPAGREPAPPLPYQGKGFWDMWQEAKWLRKLSGNTAVAFMLIFLVLLAAGSYADAVDFRRMNADMFAQLADSMASAQGASGLDSTQRTMLKQVAAEARNTAQPDLLERLGLKILSVLGSIGFFVFCSAAVAEISFRVYEGREMESYEVLDTLIKTHGKKLAQLGGIFLVLLLTVGVITLLIDRVDASWATWTMLVLVFGQFYFQYRFSLSVQALIGEEMGPRDAIARSWQLTKGNLLRIFWWSICFSFLFGLIAFFVYLVPLAIGAAILGTILSDAPEILLTIVALIALAVMVKHFSLIFFFQMAIYRELRLRKDGVDPLPSHNNDPLLSPGLV